VVNLFYEEYDSDTNGKLPRGGVNRQSNLKLTYFKQLKIAESDMSGLESDMSSHQKL
jgi:hypothetical protein